MKYKGRPYKLRKGYSNVYGSEYLRKNRFVIDHNESIVFKEVHVVDQLPAGEFIPTRDKASNGVLMPVERNSQITSVRQILNEQKREEIGAITYSELNSTINRMTASQHPNYNQGFIPVHKYFPMELYSRGMQLAKENIQKFLDAREIYEDNNMDYKRSILLYGDPGTGKSQFIYKLGEELIEQNEAIVVRIEESNALHLFTDHILGSLALYPGRFKVIVVEELADLCNSSSNTTRLLNMLDSLKFRHNVLFLMTTNHPERIPANIVDRPSRIDLLCSVGIDDLDKEFTESWSEFCLGRPLTELEKSGRWIDEVAGKLSPAYYKELFTYSRLHQISLDDAWKIIKERRTEIQNDFDTREPIGF